MKLQEQIKKEKKRGKEKIGRHSRNEDGRRRYIEEKRMEEELVCFF
jgi:hypothetical protein